MNAYIECFPSEVTTFGLAHLQVFRDIFQNALMSRYRMMSIIIVVIMKLTPCDYSKIIYSEVGRFRAKW